MLKSFISLFFLIFAAEASAQDCNEIRFDPGASSAVVSGQVIKGSPMCLTFGTGAGQTASLELSGSDNACITIEDVVDCQTSYSFQTGQRDYRFRIFQLFPRAPAENVSLRLSIR